MASYSLGPEGTAAGSPLPGASAEPVPVPGGRGRLSRAAKGLLRLAVSLGLLAAIASRVDGRELIRAVLEAEPGYWLAAWGSYLASQVVSSVRWWRLVRAVGLTATWPECLRLYFEAMFFGLGLPGSMGGDAYRAYCLSQNWRDRALAGLSVAGDRGGGILVLSLLAAAAWTVARGATNWWGGAALLLVLLAGCWVGLLAAWRWLLAVGRRGWLPGRWASLVRTGSTGSVGRLAAEVMALSLLVQLLNVVTVALIGAGIGLSVGLGAYGFAVPLSALLAALPITLSGLGLREGGLAWLLTGFGVSQAQGLLLGLLWFAVIVAASLMGGLVFVCGRRLEGVVGQGRRAVPTVLSPARVEVPQGGATR